MTEKIHIDTVSLLLLYKEIEKIFKLFEKRNLLPKIDN
jgi:hypothetical protein